MIKKILLLLIISFGLLACDNGTTTNTDDTDTKEYISEATFVNNSSYDLTITDEWGYYFDTIIVPANESVVQGITDEDFSTSVVYSSEGVTLVNEVDIIVEWGDNNTITIYDIPVYVYTFVNNSSYDITIEDDSLSGNKFEDFVVAAGTTETLTITLTEIVDDYSLEWEASGNDMTTLSVDNETLTYTFIDW